MNIFNHPNVVGGLIFLLPLVLVLNVVITYLLRVVLLKEKGLTFFGHIRNLGWRVIAYQTIISYGVVALSYIVSKLF